MYIIINCFYFIESSPSGSPKRNKRPVSLVVDGGKSLPAITETTELVSFKDGLNGYGDRNLMKNLVFNDLSTQLTNANYNFNPKIIERAENLLGKASLDNTDLTITSLNYIDEQHQNGNVANGRSLQAYFDRQNSRSPETFNKFVPLFLFVFFFLIFLIFFFY